jgi:hypothetical protein
MGIFHRAIEWMGDHKLATAALGVGAGYLFVSKVASAAPLPAAQKTVQLPGGGLVTPTHVVPPPSAHSTGQMFYVTTQDPAPEGNLNARATADLVNGQPIGAKVGYWPKYGPVELLDAGNGTMVYVRGPGFGPDDVAITLEGWAWKGFLQQRDPLSMLQTFVSSQQ